MQCRSSDKNQKTNLVHCQLCAWFCARHFIGIIPFHAHRQLRQLLLFPFRDEETGHIMTLLRAMQYSIAFPFKIAFLVIAVVPAVLP